MELVDTPVSNTGSKECGFDSLFPHQPISSMVERGPYKALMAGSNPPSATKKFIARVAQSEERLPCKQLVEGSIPSAGSKSVCGANLLWERRVPRLQTRWSS